MTDQDRAFIMKSLPRPFIDSRETAIEKLKAAEAYLLEKLRPYGINPRQQMTIEDSFNAALDVISSQPPDVLPQIQMPTTEPSRGARGGAAR